MPDIAKFFITAEVMGLAIFSIGTGIGLIKDSAPQPQQTATIPHRAQYLALASSLAQYPQNCKAILDHHPRMRDFDGPYGSFWGTKGATLLIESEGECNQRHHADRVYMNAVLLWDYLKHVL